MNRFRECVGAFLAGALLVGVAGASSHREAPLITELPKVDGTDFYMFMGYEAGRGDFVTFLANYLPLQDAYGGPNYFGLDPDALYEIHVDNDADAVEDLTFQFRFTTTNNDTRLTIGTEQVAIPLINAGPIGPGRDDTAALGVVETYTVKLVTGDRRLGVVQDVTETGTGVATFKKPVDNIGAKSIPDYASYSAAHIYTIDIPGCANTGRLFVGQRQEPFYVNLGQVFDLVNIANPVGEANAAAETNTIEDKNVTTLALEVHKDCLVAGDAVIGAWTTASLRQARVINRAPDFVAGRGATREGGAWTQVSRLGMPLVNEVVIGLRDKDRFNTAEPRDDGQFLTYVTNPTLPALLKTLFPALPDPPAPPRNDLVEVFLQGVNGLNRPSSPTAVASEMLRLNTGIAAVAPASQNVLGVIGGDNAGFPNGRRPGDDVVDIELRVAYGLLATPAVNVELTDGVRKGAADFPGTFPYVNLALPGSP